MSKSRVVNSAVNTIFNFSVKLFDFGIKFVLRTVFIYTLGMQYVGVSVHVYGYFISFVFR